jgi:hypothetical protein
VSHIHSHTCQTYSRVCKKHTLRVLSDSAFGNLTLRVETNLVRVEITLVRVEITLLRVEITLVPIQITLRVEITLCV